MGHLRYLTAAILVAQVVGPAAASAGSTAWYEGFEGPTTSWHDAGGDGQYRVVSHQRPRGIAHTGDGCEWLQVQGTGGTYVYIRHDVGQPSIIDELRPSLWIKSDRPGIQLAVRILLPRTRDPQTQQPLAVVVPGASYNDVGRWQQLQATDLPKQLARHVRSLRMQHGPQIDGREAYVDAVLLNVYGGPGLTNVWIDDLDVAGFVVAPPTQPYGRSIDAPTAPIASANTPASARRVQIDGSVLLVDGRPFFPRAVQYQGEPLAALRKLGFNAVWLDRLPSPALLDEAVAAGVWIVGPPPRPDRLDLPDETSTVLSPVGPEYQGVLCWDLGQGLGDNEVEETRRWARQLKMADRGGRPLICHAHSQLLAYSRACDLLLLDRRPLGGSLELADYATWVRQQPRLARPGTPVWTTVQTQLSPAVRHQLALLDPTRRPPSGVAPEQLRLLVYYAVAAGSRGLLFLSDSPLTADDPDTRARAIALELANLEIELLEPWAAGGSLMAFVESNVSQVTGAVLRADRARLLMPMWSAPGAQFVPAQSATNDLMLTVPGVPEAISAYELRPGGVDTLEHKRVTGGTRITLDEFGLTELILLAQDPLIVNALMQRATTIGPRAAELHREMALAKFQRVEEVVSQLAPRAAIAPQTNEWLSAAHRSIERCNQWMASRHFADAYLEAARAMRAMRLVERAAWEKSVQGLPSPIASPGAVCFSSLPVHWRSADRISTSQLGPNLLMGGDFERIDAMVQSGWRNWQRPPAHVTTHVELSPQSGRGGSLGTHLIVKAEQPDAAPAAIETPPILITSAPVAVEAGQLICIHGWVNIPQPLAATVDGLMVYDSIGGEPLAARFIKTNGWERFLLYRLVPQSGTASVNISVTGLGEVHLDDIAIEVLYPPTAVAR